MLEEQLKWHTENTCVRYLNFPWLQLLVVYFKEKKEKEEKIIDSTGMN